MAWIALIFAGIFECIGVIGITKVNQRPGFQSYATLIGGFALSFLLLSVAMESIGMGTAYAVWTGIGTVGATLIGMLFYGEPKNAQRIFFISLIIVSVVGLRLISG
ncbi:DMT family transporter [Virgibacillus xinjiangensis]|uniref:DMT family transporter n=1 Tax=Virgibacillus xinjiangensis TaxID=393090 RepID=A0ABV7CWU7_9BACI